METVELKTPKLRSLRLSKAWGQADLAEKSRVSRATIVHLEGGGEGRPSTVRKLAEALKVPPAQLIGTEPTSESSSHDVWEAETGSGAPSVSL